MTYDFFLSKFNSKYVMLKSKWSFDKNVSSQLKAFAL